MKFTARADELLRALTSARCVANKSGMIRVSVSGNVVMFSQTDGTIDPSIFVDAWLTAKEVTGEDEYLFDAARLGDLLSLVPSGLDVSISIKKVPGAARGRASFSAPRVNGELALAPPDERLRPSYPEPDGWMNLTKEQINSLLVPHEEFVPYAQNTSVNQAAEGRAMALTTIAGLFSVVDTDGENVPNTMIPTKNLLMASKATESERLSFAGSKVVLEGNNCRAVLMTVIDPPAQKNHERFVAPLDMTAEFSLEAKAAKNILGAASGFLSEQITRGQSVPSVLRLECDGEKLWFRIRAVHNFDAAMDVEGKAEPFKAAFQPEYLKRVLNDAGEGLYQFCIHKLSGLVLLRCNRGSTWHILLPLVLKGD